MLFGLPEYERSAHLNAFRAVDELMRARSPLFAEMRRVPTEAVPVARISDGSGGELERPPVPVTLRMEISIRDVTAGDLGPVFTALDDMAEQQEATLSEELFASMREITDMTGNTVHAGGRPPSLDLLTEVMEKMEVPFDEAGQPTLALVMSPSGAERLQQLGPPTPEQQARHDAMLERKRREWEQRRRQRRLR